MAKSKKNEIPAQEEKVPEAELLEKEEEAPKENPLAAELSAEKDRYLRLAAEYDNFRKRSMKERESMFTDVRCDTITKILPVYDNLARALRQECTDEAFYKGVEMTMTQLKDVFDKLGVSEISALGEQFNPEFHNAVMHVEDDSAGENTVVEEFEKGFMLGGKVIRFSVVKVAN